MGSGINGNVIFSISKDSSFLPLPLWEVELMETEFPPQRTHTFLVTASLMGSGINGNCQSTSEYVETQGPLPLWEVELMETIPSLVR
jgi:hypothetical protein